MKVTISDVARLAGVSPATVSRILNDNQLYKTTDETRERVLRAVTELGYQAPVKKRPAASLQEAGMEFCYLDGSTKDRLGECRRFNTDESIPLFLISLHAGGTGLNLTGADMVVHFDPWWNPAVENQATDRAYRIGQTRFVHVHKMVASGTLEEKIDAMLEKKQTLNDEIVQSDNWITELSGDELKELLVLDL